MIKFSGLIIVSDPRATKPIYLLGSRKRVSPVQFDAKPTPTTTDRKRPRRSSERGGKGLRHFSSKVRSR